MMKRKLLIFLLVFACAVSAAGCSSGGKAPDQEEPDSEILKEMGTVNQLDNLLKNHERVALEHSFYFKDGAVETWYIYKDEELFVSDLNGDLAICSNDLLYGFDPSLGYPYAFLTMDTTPQEIVSELETGVVFQYNEIETIVSSSEKDGVLYLETTADIGEAEQEAFDYYGYDIQDGDSTIYRYEMDSATKEIQSMTVTIRPKNGEDYVVHKMERVKDPEKYQPDEQLVSQIFNEDSRTVTVIADPGTENETSYSCTVGKGCMVSIYVSGPQRAFYDDEACTKQVTEDRIEDLNADATLYTKTIAAE